MAYVTGSHALKVGIHLFRGVLNQYNSHPTGNEEFQTVNGRPTAVTYYGDPSTSESYIRPNLGVYGQDQWIVKRVTVNAGLRFDYWSTGFENQSIAPTQYVPVTRSVPGRVAVSWKDLSPRLGVAYDVFGTGKTALKASINRYVLQQNSSLATALNPIVNNNSVTRTWTDTDGDYVVQGDPLNPAANGELGRSTNLNFGNPATNTAYAPAWATGFNKRPYNWEMSASIQHELMPRLSVNAAYFRRVYGNFYVTDNTAVSASDYSPYCVPVPVDSRLPTRGGQPLCGLFDLNPNQVGKISNVVTAAGNFGNVYEHWNGVDLTMTARLPKVQLQGGLSTGKTMTDNCDIVTNSPQIIVPAPAGADLPLQSGPSTPTGYCHIETPFLTQVKLLGSYTLPWEVAFAATYQSIPGRQVNANAIFTSAQVAPSLGRPLGSASTVTVNIAAPAAVYAERLNQVDLRFTKIFRVGRRQFRGMVDLYNVLNDNSVLTPSNTYGTTGAAWLNPLVIMPPRLAKLGVQFDF
jgi:hypothetical protein